MPNTKATLLIADDEPSIRLALSQSLAEMGYSVRSAAPSIPATGCARQIASIVTVRFTTQSCQLRARRLCRHFSEGLRRQCLFS